MTPRERPFAHLEEIPGAGARQRALRDKWLTGAP
jgi:hypothetical protein